MNLSQLAKASKLELAIAEAQGKVKVTRLPMRKARKNELAFTSGYRTTGVRAAGVKIRGGNGHNAGGKVA